MIKISEPFGSPNPNENQYLKKEGYYDGCLSPPKDYAYEIRYVKDYYDTDEDQQWYMAEILLCDTECDGMIIDVLHILDDDFEYDLNVRGNSYVKFDDSVFHNLSLAIAECKETLWKLNGFEVKCP